MLPVALKDFGDDISIFLRFFKSWTDFSKFPPSHLPLTLSSTEAQATLAKTRLMPKSLSPPVL